MLKNNNSKFKYSSIKPKCPTDSQSQPKLNFIDFPRSNLENSPQSLKPIFTTSKNKGSLKEIGGEI